MKTIYFGIIMSEDMNKVIKVMVYKTKEERRIAWEALDVTWNVENPYNFYMWYVDATINIYNECIAIRQYVELSNAALVAINDTLKEMHIK